MPKSLLSKATLLLLLILPGSALLSKAPGDPSCDSIQVKIEISSSSIPGKGNITATVTGGETPIYYIFYKASGQLLSKDVLSGKVNDIDPGTYFCSIVDGKGCNKKTEFKID